MKQVVNLVVNLHMYSLEEEGMQQLKQNSEKENDW